MISEVLPDERHRSHSFRAMFRKPFVHPFSTSRRRGIRSKARHNKPAGKSLLLATLLHHNALALLRVQLGLLYRDQIGWVAACTSLSTWPRARMRYTRQLLALAGALIRERDDMAGFIEAVPKLVQSFQFARIFGAFWPSESRKTY